LFLFHIMRFSVVLCVCVRLTSAEAVGKELDPASPGG
jgi:hypothetical protein